MQRRVSFGEKWHERSEGGESEREHSQREREREGDREDGERGNQ